MSYVKAVAWLYRGHCDYILKGTQGVSLEGLGWWCIGNQDIITPEKTKENMTGPSEALSYRGESWLRTHAVPGGHQCLPRERGLPLLCALC